MQPVYMVRFTREFVTGHLKGIFIDSELPFATLEAANDYIRYLHAHKESPVDAIGGADYICHMARIVTEH